MHGSHFRRRCRSLGWGCLRVQHIGNSLEQHLFQHREFRHFSHNHFQQPGCRFRFRSQIGTIHRASHPNCSSKLELVAGSPVVAGATAVGSSSAAVGIVGWQQQRTRGLIQQ